MAYRKELQCRRAPEQYRILQTGKGNVCDDHYRHVGGFFACRTIRC